MITSATPIGSNTNTKKNSVDLVTETDQAVEKMISTRLKEEYPTFQFLGEETYEPGMKLTEAPTFVVDPIDGTTNFVSFFTPAVSVLEMPQLRTVILTEFLTGSPLPLRLRLNRLRHQQRTRHRRCVQPFYKTDVHQHQRRRVISDRVSWRCRRGGRVAETETAAPAATGASHAAERCVDGY